MEKISLVVSCYNEEESIPLFYDEVTQVMKTIEKYDYEIILINDGSDDRTIDVIKELAQKDRHYSTYPFLEILEKKQQCTLACNMHKVILLQFWMRICRIRRL